MNSRRALSGIIFCTSFALIAGAFGVLVVLLGLDGPDPAYKGSGLMMFAISIALGLAGLPVFFVCWARCRNWNGIFILAASIVMMSIIASTSELSFFLMPIFNLAFAGILSMALPTGEKRSD